MARRTKMNLRQRILSIFFVFISLMSIVGMVSVTAINVNANDVISKIDDAMKAWMIASTMKKCLEEDIDAGENGMDDVRNAEYLDISNVIVGPWFENFVGGEVDDGRISGCAADGVGGERTGDGSNVIKIGMNPPKKIEIMQKNT